MGTKRILLVPITKWPIPESPLTFRYCCILHCCTYFLLFKPAVLYVICGPTDAVCICMETLHVTTVSRVMYGKFSCYHSFYGFVVRTRMVLQALWKSPILGTENILFMVFRTTALTHVTIACYIFCVECTVFMMMHYSLPSLVINIYAHS